MRIQKKKKIIIIIIIQLLEETSVSGGYKQTDVPNNNPYKIMRASTAGKLRG